MNRDFDLIRIIRNTPIRIRNSQFNRYVEKQKERGREFGIVDGTNETYAFDINDRTIEQKMYSMRKTYAQYEMDLFLNLVSKYYGQRPESGGGIS